MIDTLDWSWQNILGLVTAYSILLPFLENDGSCIRTWKILQGLERSRKMPFLNLAQCMMTFRGPFRTVPKSFVTVTGQKWKIHFNFGLFVNVFPLFKKKDLLNWPEKGFVCLIFLFIKNRAKYWEREEREREREKTKENVYFYFYF